MHTRQDYTHCILPARDVVLTIFRRRMHGSLGHRSGALTTVCVSCSHTWFHRAGVRPSGAPPGAVQHQGGAGGALLHVLGPRGVLGSAEAAGRSRQDARGRSPSGPPFSTPARHDSTAWHGCNKLEVLRGSSTCSGPLGFFTACLGRRESHKRSW